MALPDEVATTLSSVRTLVDSSLRDDRENMRKADVDLQQAGKEMHVGRIVTGHYQKVRNRVAT